MTFLSNFQFSGKYRRMAFVLMGLGLGALAWGFYRDPVRAWVNILLNNFYLLSLGAAALFFIAVHYLTASSWWVGLRRVPEAMMSVLPAAALLMLLLWFGRHSLYHWSDAEAVLQDALLSKKQAWLDAPFFFARMAFILGLWTLFARLIRKRSIEQDLASGQDHHRQIFRLSAVFIPVFAFTFSVASFDWIMSVEPHWFSTIFAIYNFAGLFLHGVAVIALAVILLKERGYLDGVVNENHLQDLSKLILAFSTFWVCMWVNQYMLIWYSNIPEEAVYYAVRTDRDWYWLFVLNVVVNWGIPFLILVVRRAKRSAAVLKRVCILLLVGHWLDLYLMIAPNVVRTRTIGPMEILVSLGYGALFFYLTARALSRAPLVARNDPYLEESLHHHQ